jgi:hypothetical protein
VTAAQARLLTVGEAFLPHRSMDPTVCTGTLRFVDCRGPMLEVECDAPACRYVLGVRRETAERELAPPREEPWWQR